MTATATIDGTAASTGRLPSVASAVVELIWPLYLTLVSTLGAWVLVPTLVLGWQPITIISGSMAPTVQPGHVVVVEPYRGQELEPGTVVTYRDAEIDRLVTHRIVSVGEDGSYTTRGDANAVDDRLPLTTDRIVGVGKLVVPAAGLPALWSHEGRTDLLAGFGALTVLAASAAAGAASEATRSIRRRLSSRSARGALRPVVLGTGVVAIVAVLGATAVSRAAFVGADENAANSFAAGTIGVPSDLAASSSCVLILLEPEVQLQWTAGESAESYEVLRSLSADSGFTSVGTTSTTSFTDTTVSGGTTYHYRVRSLAGGWSSAESATASTTTPVCL